jgi:hypothetical protein
MHQSRTLAIGLEGHQGSSAGADVAPEDHAEGVSLGHSDTRPCALEPRIRKRSSQRHHRVFVSEAGPCGDWLYRSLTKKAIAAGASPLL